LPRGCGLQAMQQQDSQARYKWGTIGGDGCYKQARRRYKTENRRLWPLSKGAPREAISSAIG